MSAGKLRDRAKFYEPVKTTDRFGNSTDGDFELRGSRWVQLEEVSAREATRFIAPRDTADATIVVRQDALMDRVKSNWRVDVRDFQWRIDGVSHQGNKDRYLEMSVIRGVPL